MKIVMDKYEMNYSRNVFNSDNFNFVKVEKNLNKSILFV